ncbi:MAG: alpha-1,2-fucosyltransferase [Lachnospiraceae bacterium]|nr:alpha-1,2-fucosyltransferase [Lachnospiraceae bacterium]
MLMLQMTGGMGNQMFVYALYKALENVGKEVCIEDFTHYEDIGRKDNLLEKIFDFTYRKGERAEYNRLTDSSLLPWKRVRRKLFGRGGRIYQEKDAIAFEEEIFDKEEAYCIGYWQSFRYFESVEEQIRKDFSFERTILSPKAQAYREQIENACSVSVHIRRGDYLNEKFAAIYGGICTQAYYRSAMDYFTEYFPECRFFLFTDDTEWGRTYAKGNMTLVDCGGSDGAHVDMALMSLCRHNIIANSSFSWWGAWLNRNPEKKVVAPKLWLNASEGQDIFYKLCNVRIDEDGRRVQ